MIHKGTKTLETERLILRKAVPEDAEPAFRNWMSDDAVTRFLTWPAHRDIPETERVIGEWISKYSDPSFYRWIIVLKETGEPIGSVYVVSINDAAGSANMGYCLGRSWWNKGLAAEAFKAVINYLFYEVEFKRIEACHAPENPGSGAVMRKCGLTYEATLRKSILCNAGITDLCHYSILREEHRASMLRGTFNTRDLGGYKTADGRETKYWRILRSSKLFAYVPGDIELLREKGVTTVLDLRDQADLDRSPVSFKDAPGFDYRNFRIDAASSMPETVEEMPDMYMDIARSGIMKDFFEALAESGTGVLFNCYSGKDRTGIVSAFILLLCGVSMEDVMKDYMVSNANCEPVYRYLAEHRPEEQFFETLYGEYGSLSGYFDRIGVSEETRDKIRSKLMD